MHKTFKNGLKKRRKIAQSSFCFCQLIIIDDYERLLSLLSDAFAAFPSTPNKLWVRNFLFLPKLFWNIFQTWNSIWWLENDWFAAKKESPNRPWKGCQNTRESGRFVLDINDHKATGYDRKIDIGKVLEIDDSDAKSHFMNMLRLYQWVQFSTSPKRRMKFGLAS